jgi:hypothetical protein
MVQTLAHRVRCESDGDTYHVTVPATSAEEAVRLATAQGHTVLDDAEPTTLTAGSPPVSNLGKIAVALSFGGLFFPVLALIGLVLGVQEKNTTAIRVGTFCLIAWVFLVIVLIANL